MSNRLMSKKLLLGCAAIALAVAGITSVAIAATKPAASSASTHQVVTGPVAEYWVSTTTSTGLSLSGLGGGGRPSLGSMMNMMKGGVSHSMRLQLGSTNAASGDPTGDHLPPAALDAGNDLPLYYKAPVAQKETYTPEQHDDTPQQSEPPKGKILIFWGCGEHAPKNQPVVIDLSKLTDPSERMTMMSKMMPAPVQLDQIHPPSPDRWKTYGEWPNIKSKTGLGANSSLLGAHTVKANYSPQIDFTLAQDQDFMAPIQIAGNNRDGEGAIPLTWTALGNAKGIILSAIGSGGKDADGGSILIMWTSAQSQMGWTGLAADYLTPHDSERLVASKVLLPGTATACTVPAEVTGQTQGMMYSMTAYGGEANFAYPPRPEDLKTPWNIQWETKVRYKTTTGGILGQSTGGGWGGAQSGASNSSSSSDGGKKKKGFGFGDMVKQGLGSMIPGGG